MSLLESIQGLIERTYDMRPGLPDVARFIIGDRGYRALYAEGRTSAALAGSAETGARTIVRETREGLRACVYYPDALIHQLERHPPSRGVGDENVEAFATLVEELDHLLLLAERARHDRPLKLELFGHGGRVQPSGTAERKDGEFPRVETSANGVGTNALRYS